MEIQFVVESQFEGNRLDYVVAAKVNGYSRSLIAQLIKNGKILVSGKSKKPSFKVHLGDLISLLLHDHKNKSHIEPDANFIKKRPFDIIYEDSHILVINKYPNIIVHPGAGNSSGTLVNSLINYYPKIKSVGEDILRPGIVHRLDKDTSGVMVIAKNNQAFLFLKKEFMQRRVEKIYIALVSGLLKEDSGQIILPIGRHPVKRKMMSTITANGRYAKTIWQVRERYDNATLVEAELKTGRTHQLRVHFKAIGHPLVGDTVYGFKKRGLQVNGVKKRGNISYKICSTIARQMLHAWKLTFRHPWSGRRVEFIAQLPDDMTQFV